MPSKPPAACTVSWKASASSGLSNSNTRPPASPTPASASADRSAPSLPTLAFAPANSSPAASVLSTIVNLDEPSEKSSRIRIESLSTWTKATKTLALAEVVDWPTRHFSGVARDLLGAALAAEDLADGLLGGRPDLLVEVEQEERRRR